MEESREFNVDQKQDECCSPENHFKIEQLRKNLQKFSFPRLAGTKGEVKAVDLVVQTFNTIGFPKTQIRKQQFSFSTFYSVYLLKIFALINAIAIVILLFMRYINNILLYLLSIIALLILISFHNIFRHPESKGFWERHFGKKISATNIFLKIPANNASSKNDTGTIIISAHLDSKSQTFKTIWRVAFSTLWLISEIILVFFYILYFLELLNIENYSQKVSFLIIEGFIISLTLVIIFLNLLMFFSKTGNESPGALDNASGMSIIFELSSYFKNNPLNNYNLFCCIFSGEELGTMGSRFFVDSYENQFDPENTFHINLDMVSAKSRKNNQVDYIKSYGMLPPKKTAPILSDYLRKAADTEGLKVFGFHVIQGGHTDTVPFHLRKYKTIDITTRAAAKYSHSKSDTPDKVDLRLLIETCIILRRTVLMIDEVFNLENSLKKN